MSSHASKLLGCTMKYSVYMPAGPGPFPVLWYLSGLTCNEQNCIQKGGFQQYAAANSIGFFWFETFSSFSAYFRGNHGEEISKGFFSFFSKNNIFKNLSRKSPL